MKMLDRRAALAGALGLVVTACVAKRTSRLPQENFVARLRSIEEAAGGQLGAFVLDTGNGETLGWRSDQRFCHCSTFKLSLVAMALREADAGRIDLSEALSFSQSDIVEYSPVVEKNLAAGQLPIIALAEAAQVISDNAAANLLMRRLGGPQSLTQFWRDIGDDVSRIDGYEPEINVIPPGTQENSTTPKAMAHTLANIVLGDVLSSESRELLRNWMEATRTGLRRIQAGIPESWSALDKTGTGMRPAIGNKTNNIAVLFPTADRAPLVVTGYFEHPDFSESIRSDDEAVLKSLGEIAVDWAAAA